MKKTLISILLFTVTIYLSAQDQKKVDNYSFFKLYVTNDKNEVLLIGGQDWWEITGSRYNQSMTVLEFVHWMGKRMGIEIENIRLRGMFTFYYDWWQTMRPTLLQYYTAEYKYGDLIIPDGCEYIKWVNKDSLKDYIPYNEMVMILDRINENDDLVGGNFIVSKTEDGKRRGKLIGDFYKLH